MIYQCDSMLDFLFNKNIKWKFSILSLKFRQLQSGGVTEINIFENSRSAVYEVRYYILIQK